MSRPSFFRRRKTCPFSGDNAQKIDYKDTKLLARFTSERALSRGKRKARRAPLPVSQAFRRNAPGV